MRTKHNTYIGEMIAEKWAMEPTRLEALAVKASGQQLLSETISAIEIANVNKMSVVDGVAIINIDGVLMKTVPFWYRLCGCTATSYIDIQDQVELAANDKNIKKIVLRVNSPGGSVSGLYEVTEAVYQASQKKKVIAEVPDLAASAAYWIASQASQIIAGPNAEIGSIGVFTVLSDYSEMATQLGIKIIMVQSGSHKGTGYPGAAISEEQLEPIQNIIDALAANFIQGIARGRKLSPAAVKELADGRVWIAKEAKAKKLIDKVQIINSKTKGETMPVETKQTEQVGSKGDAESKTETTEVNSEAVNNTGETSTPKAQAASLTELKAEFPDDAEFVLDQAEKGASMADSKAAYCDVLRKKLSDRDANEESSGAPPVGHTPGGSSVNHTSFVEEAKKLAEDKGITKTAAMQKLAKENPDLYLSQFRNRK